VKGGERGGGWGRGGVWGGGGGCTACIELSSIRYQVSSMEYQVWSMEYGVWSMEYGVGIEYVFLCFQVLLTVLREIQLFNPGMQSLCDSTCDVVFKTSTPPLWLGDGYHGVSRVSSISLAVPFPCMHRTIMSLTFEVLQSA